MFDENYEVIVADTPAARRIHHQIRYQVYCVEHGYEDPGRHPDQEERDEWDAHAVHFLVRERASGEWIGAMRLVKPVNGILPIHRAAKLQPGSGPVEDGGKAWELSRTCILRDYRRGCRLNDHVGQLQPFGNRSEASGDPWQPRSSVSKRINWVAMAKLRAAHLATLAANGGVRRGMATGAPSGAGPSRHGSLRVNGYEILAGMLRAAIEYTRDHDTYHLYFLINRALARMVRRMQLDIIEAGGPVEHRGVRHPYVANLNELVFGAVRRSPEMAKLFLEGEDPYRHYSVIRSSLQRGPEPGDVAAA